MKKICLLLLLFINLSLVAQTSKYKSLWTKVHQYELEGLPKTAAKEVAKIYKIAKRDGQQAQKIKCLLYQSKFSITLEEEAKLKVINHFKEVIEQTDNVGSKAVLHSMLAHIYWDYYQSNRWKIHNRTQTTAKNNTDFRTWDLATLLAEVQKHYQFSLQNEEVLQNISREEFSEILKAHDDEKDYKRTLYDVLVHNAIEFYQNSQSNINQAKEPFHIDKKEYLEEIEKFNITTSDTLSNKYKSLQLYQQLIKYHKAKNNELAYVQSILRAVHFIEKNQQIANFLTVKLNYLKGLKSQIKVSENRVYIDFEIAKAHYSLAETFEPKKQTQYQFEFVKALEICETILKEHPKHQLAKSCEQLEKVILHQNVNCRLLQYTPVGSHVKSLVSYRNVTNFQATIYQINQKTSLLLQNTYNRDKKDSIIKLLPVYKSWQVTLPNQKDHQQHSTEILLPDLEQGSYLFTGIVNGDKVVNDYKEFKVTDLTFLKIAENRYQILNRVNGKVVEGAKIQISNKHINQRARYNIEKNFVTDKNGEFTFKASRYYANCVVSVRTNTENTYFDHISFYKKRTYQSKNNTTHYKAFIFTDRSIYRPGQKVFFKTILLSKKGEETALLANKSVEVKLYDVNQQEVKKEILTLNDFASANTTFTLPTSGLNGVYSFKVYYKNKYISSRNSTVSVEEYKRPKFETNFNPVKGTYKVNDSIKVEGEALALAGSKITNAKVQYRVVRKAQYPRWCWWMPAVNKQTEIANGETTTNHEGIYTIPFKAHPDVTVAKEHQPVFYYTVYADVTDINGETRSAETRVAVGYHALNLSINVADKLNVLEKNNIEVHSENLNGVWTDTQGTVKIYKLLAPQTPKVASPWERPDIVGITAKEHQKLFPNIFEDKHFKDFKKWEKGTLVYSKKFDTKKSKTLALGKIKKWELGKYIIEATSTDKWGQEVKDKKWVEVYDPKAKKVADQKMFTIFTDKRQYQPGDKVVLSLGSASKNMNIMVEVEKNHQLFSQHQIFLSNDIKTLEIPVTENDKGGFAIKWHWVNSNHLESGAVHIPVPYPSKELSIETLTFRDLLEPGAKQKWQFKIKGPQQEKVSAEVLASMYDISLDQFMPHALNFNPEQLPIYRAYHQVTSYDNFKTSNLSVTNGYRSFYHYVVFDKDDFNWFGFSIDNNRWVNKRYLQSISYAKASISKYKDKSIPKGKVKITVLDAFKKEPIPGVAISSGKNQFVSDFDGIAIVDTKYKTKLELTYLGYETYTFKVDKKYNSYTVKLAASSDELDEVVVVGYGKHRKSLLSESTTSFETVSESLEETSNIRIRGVSSLSGTTNPLFVVDGVPVEGNPNFPPEEIASIDVLKDAASKSIYGSRGANGVIVINTKEALKSKVSSQALNNVKARTNFNETAFFFPQLRTNEKGEVSFEFTMPEDLTRWKLQLIAHDKALNTGTKTLTAVTQKQLMVVPNPPRFLREGDAIMLTTKIANLSKDMQEGSVKLELTNPMTGKKVDALFQNHQSVQNFSITKEGNTSVSWKLQIPENMGAVQYKIVAATQRFSDGEQNILPILSNRMLVTETLPLWANGGQSKTFTLAGLKNSSSQSLKHHQLSLEITSNPAWYAVQALPYLMEYPYECAEQTFARYYANQLASHIVNSSPKIKEVFEQWANSETLMSNLEKNAELKSIIIEETPWLRDAQSEAEQKKRMALLFNLSKMEANLKSAIKKLDHMQMSNGGFPWFKGSDDANRYITQHIVQGYHHLKKLGVSIDDKRLEKMIDKAESYLDDELIESYDLLLEQADRLQQLAKTKKEGVKATQNYLSKKHLYSFQLQYLYVLSFDQNRKLKGRLKEAVSYYTQQAEEFWKEESLYNKGIIALVFHRENNTSVAKNILNSLQENSVLSEEMGRYWKENKASWYWYQDPIVTQSLMIEVFSEVAANTLLVDELKQWLLKNKQVQQWNTTKATSEAIYALLLQGSDWLSVTEAVEVTIGGQPIPKVKMKDVTVEASTGYFKTHWKADEITKDLATVTLTKKEKGVAWGGLYWQYFEDLDKIKQAETPLSLKKEAYIKKNTEQGIKLIAIKGSIALKVGDLLTVRIELTSDRDMEFIHMKDMRAAGLEPIDVISQYKWQDGLGYYQTTKDTATHFFFDRIKKGIYVFEYDLRVSHQGTFSNGITNIESMYAPEFSSHSKGVKIRVE
ncbi:alpha-2-macroglobulin family protein [Wenyingzhuangia sp. IMCC45533]